MTCQLFEEGVDYDNAVKSFKQSYISAALERCKGNQCKAAALMKVHRNTIGRLCDGLGIDPTTFRPKAVRAAALEARRLRRSM